jgi:hypothetical protein
MPHIELQEYDDQLRDIVDLIEKTLLNDVSKLTGPARLEVRNIIRSTPSKEAPE